MADLPVLEPSAVRFVFQRADGCSGNGYACERCGCLWVDHIAPGCQCPTVPGSRAVDELCALWIDDAPRFGAVAAHFPESLRKRRFVASFWAPEVLLFGDFYLSGGRCWTRGLIDKWCALLIERAPGHRLASGFPFWDPYWWRVEALTAAEERALGWRPKLPFWSPELPEVLPFDGEGNARAAAGGWRDVCVFVDPVGHRRIAHRQQSEEWRHGH